MKMPFTLSQLRPIREAMTVSRPAKLGESVPVTWFSLGGGTPISRSILFMMVTESVLPYFLKDVH